MTIIRSCWSARLLRKSCMDGCLIGLGQRTKHTSRDVKAVAGQMQFFNHRFRCVTRAGAL
jgi:hypothetical protein